MFEDYQHFLFPFILLRGNEECYRDLSFRFLKEAKKKKGKNEEIRTVSKKNLTNLDESLS